MPEERWEIPKLFRYDYENQNGGRERIRKNEIYVWASVNLQTGEVDTEDLREFDDELQALTPNWEWRKFTLIPSNVSRQRPLPAGEDSHQQNQASSG
jgi:hypothetical protein